MSHKISINPLKNLWDCGIDFHQAVIVTAYLGQRMLCLQFPAGMSKRIGDAVWQGVRVFIIDRFQGCEVTERHTKPLDHLGVHIAQTQTATNLELKCCPALRTPEMRKSLTRET